ncbi:hypothetical protein BDN72DRAFT_858311 [Pluteus cervinus]|uniref:Uncharacterized protein n=1 Tax=Pluteus cervinus TaxID=181527 RepID=A0ACD3ASW8_9AGAR|nr:hypothetical protein BDN72DRAFT_858311 [Pluteus cervinus]
MPITLPYDVLSLILKQALLAGVDFRTLKLLSRVCKHLAVEHFYRNHHITAHQLLDITRLIRRLNFTRSNDQHLRISEVSYNRSTPNPSLELQNTVFPRITSLRLDGSVPGICQFITTYQHALLHLEELMFSIPYFDTPSITIDLAAFTSLQSIVTGRGFNYQFLFSAERLTRLRITDQIPPLDIRDYLQTCPRLLSGNFNSLALVGPRPTLQPFQSRVVTLHIRSPGGPTVQFILHRIEFSHVQTMALCTPVISQSFLSGLPPLPALTFLSTSINGADHSLLHLINNYPRITRLSLYFIGPPLLGQAFLISDIFQVLARSRCIKELHLRFNEFSYCLTPRATDPPTQTAVLPDAKHKTFANLFRSLHPPFEHGLIELGLHQYSWLGGKLTLKRLKISDVDEFCGNLHRAESHWTERYTIPAYDTWGG